MPKDSSAKYYQNNKERQQKYTWHSILFKEEEEKGQHGWERYKNLPESIMKWKHALL